jgi:hypothetical protein
MESKSRKGSDGKIKHAETLGDEYIFQATFAYAESVRGLLRGSLPSWRNCKLGLFPPLLFAVVR